jgi:hypothetical protein
MKKIFTIVAMTLLWFVSLSAQVPQKLTYQSVIRDAAGNVINNQDLAVQITILQGSVEGPVVYSENHTTATTVNGVITVEVGGGKTSYDFTSIDWSNGPFYIRSTAELNGKSISVTSQLLSVPYSLYAHRAFLADKVDEQFLEDVIAAKIQSALEEKEAEWQSKIDALEAALDSISAQLQVPPIDTIPNDTIPTDTIPTDSIPTDTVPADTTPADTVFKSAAIHGVLPGKFSMGENYQVQFSKGMLQYLAYKDLWRFAKTQYDIIDKSYQDYWMYPPKGWADKFEHGAVNEREPECPYYYLSQGYSYDYVELAQVTGANAIHNGGNKKNLWSTPSNDEWRYLTTVRERADSLYSKGNVNGIDGYIFLPDDWSFSTDSSFKPKAENCSANVYDKKAWEKMESLGAVFMPCASYWTWGYMEYEPTAMNLTADHAYPDCHYDIDWGMYMCENSTINYADGSTPRQYRLVVPVDKATEIMNGEAIENEDLDGEDEDIPNNYLPDSLVDLSNVDMNAGLLKGKFSVSETKQVNFSKGFLLYNTNTKIWSFSGDDLGEERGWVAGFSYGTSGYSCDPMREFLLAHTYPYANSSSIAGTKYDWGVYNPISNGGNTPNIWRTPTIEEWEYLINGREKNGKKLSTLATVCGSQGMVLLPDDWDLNNELTFADTVDLNEDCYRRVIYTCEQWERMEELGAVFLVSGGMGVDIPPYDMPFEEDRLDWYGCAYWSASTAQAFLVRDHKVEYNQRPSYTYKTEITFEHNNPKNRCLVRLVRDVIK